MKQLSEAFPAPPLLVILSGPSGVGKDAALEGLKKLDRPWHFVLTATTRKMRDGEQDGIDYLFLDEKVFARMRDRGELLESAEVYGNWYGVPRSQVRDALKAGKDVVLKIDVQGAATVKNVVPEAVSIFMLPASLEDLRSRLAGRSTETSPEMDLRLATAKEEIAQASEFDYRVINRENCLDQAVAEIDAIISAEKCRMHPRVAQLL